MHTSSSQDTPHVERTSFDHLLHNEDNETGRKGDKEDGEVTPYVLGVALCASISGLIFGESDFAQMLGRVRLLTARRIFGDEGMRRRMARMEECRNRN